MLITFKTTGTAHYQAAEVSPAEAAAVGCAGATHALETRFGYRVFGYFMATGSVPGRDVRVPGWTAARRGMRAVFVPAVLDDTVAEWGQPVDGYLAIG